MANNNWHVSARVRKMGYWSKLPIIGTWLGIHISTAQIKVIVGGIVGLGVILTQYPQSDIVGEIITSILVVILTIYFSLPESDKYAPEKIKFQTFWVSLFKIGENTKFRPLTMDDIKKGD